MSALTEHARNRAEERGLSQYIPIVLEHGREVFARGAIIYVVGQREIQDARGDRKQLLQECEGIHVVCSTDDPDRVLTVYRNRSRLCIRNVSARRYGKKRRSGGST